MRSTWTWKTRNKTTAKTKSTRAARKGGPYDLRHGFRTGDQVQIVDVPRNLKDPDYKDDPEMRTAELFRFCLGRKFQVRGFDRYGFVELQPSDDPAVKKEFGLNSIWIEPDCLKLVAKTRQKVTRPADGFGWKEDFRKSEEEVKPLEREFKGIGGPRSRN